MKNRIIIIFAITVVCTSLVSCVSEFLDKPPGVDVTEDVIFSTKRDIESFIYGTYLYGLHSYYPYASNAVNPNPTLSMTAPMTDEAEMSGAFFGSQKWNSASIVRNNIINDEDTRFNLRWQALRRCNIIIERLTAENYSGPLTVGERNQFTGEALFIRALNNFEMLKRYGAMPIVNRRFQVGEDLKLPRASLEDFVNFIEEDCTEAARLLADVSYTAAQRGRVTDVAAMALKSRLLLYAASPLFNTATPYISGSDAVNKSVCYGNYDEQRWAAAAAAALEAINNYGKHGFAMIDTGDAENDYRNVWGTNDNSEIILAEKYSPRVGSWQRPWAVMVSTIVYPGAWGNATVCITHNFIRKYEKMDGTPQTWNEPGVPGNDLMVKYAELDPRFRQTVGYQGSRVTNNVPQLQLHDGGAHNFIAENITGAILQKHLPITWQSSSYYTPNGILFRVAELYLNYAEALNESLAAPSNEVYNAINRIRSRAGMPPLSGLTKEQMRERIKNERDIELAFEDHRMWDIRRWMDAEKDGVMKGDFYGVKIWQNSGAGLTAQCDYEVFKFETRSFNRNMYLHPIMENEINKGYMLQNPGW